MSQLPKFAFCVVCLALIVGHAEAQQPSQKPVYLVYVQDMHCKHCAQKIGGSLYTVKGVAKVSVQYDKKVLIVAPSRGKVLSEVDLWEAVEKADAKLLKIVSPRGTFSAKPKRGAPQADPTLSASGPGGSFSSGAI